MSVFKYTSFNSGFEIVDDLGGNIFPSAILSVATTDAQVIVPSDSNVFGESEIVYCCSGEVEDSL